MHIVRILSYILCIHHVCMMYVVYERRTRVLILLHHCMKKLIYQGGITVNFKNLFLPTRYYLSHFIMLLASIMGNS